MATNKQYDFVPPKNSELTIFGIPKKNIDVLY